MTVMEMQKKLQLMFKEQYKRDIIIQANIVQLGWAIVRCLERNEIAPFDDFEKNSEMIYKEVDYVSAGKGILKRTL